MGARPRVRPLLPYPLKGANLAAPTHFPSAAKRARLSPPSA